MGLLIPLKYLMHAKAFVSAAPLIQKNKSRSAQNLGPIIVVLHSIHIYYAVQLKLGSRFWADLLLFTFCAWLLLFEHDFFKDCPQICRILSKTWFWAVNSGRKILTNILHLDLNVMHIFALILNWHPCALNFGLFALWASPLVQKCAEFNALWHKFFNLCQIIAFTFELRRSIFNVAS